MTEWQYGHATSGSATDDPLVRNSDHFDASATVYVALNPIERAMLDYVVPWLPYGQPPFDDVFVEFGLTATAFVARIRGIVELHRYEIHPHTAMMLLDMCDRSRRDPRHAANISGA